MVTGGTLLMVIGAIALMPLLIGLGGRLGSRLPLPLRLATRDSARQRSRTAPAVAAVMAAVAGVTTLAIASSSDFEQSRIDYQPQSPPGVTTLELYGGDARTWRSLEQTTAQQVDGRRLLAYGSVGTPTDTAATQFYVARTGCPALPPRETLVPQEKCRQWMDPDLGHIYDVTSGLVAEPDALAALGYRLDAEQRAVLNAGGVLLPDAALVRDGRATLTTFADDGSRYSDVRTRIVRAGSLRPFGGTARINPVVVTPAGAKALGVSWTRTGGVLSAGTPISTATQDRWEESVRGVSQAINVYTEEIEEIDHRLADNSKLLFAEIPGLSTVEWTNSDRSVQLLKTGGSLYGFAIGERSGAVQHVYPEKLAAAIGAWPPAKRFFFTHLGKKRLRIGTFTRGDRILLVAADVSCAV